MDFTTEIAIYSIILALIICLACTGSIFTIYFYRKQKPMTNGGIFILTLASLDIFAVLVFAPQYLLVPTRASFRKHGLTYYTSRLYAVTLECVVLSYLFILTAVALDRLIAVWRPFSYNRSPRRCLATVVTLVAMALCASIVTVTVETDEGNIVRLTLVAFIIGSFVTLFVAYSLIVYKLRKQRRKVNNGTGRHQPTEVPRQQGPSTKTLEG